MYNVSRNVLIFIRRILLVRLISLWVFPDTLFSLSAFSLCAYFHLAHSLKGTVSRDFRLHSFFHEPVSPKPLSISLGPFQIFLKIRGDIRSSRCTTRVFKGTVRPDWI
jgi:hypothetical protein